MDDAEKLELYRTALCQIVHEAGGHLTLGPHDLDKPGSLMNRPTDDGGIEFRYVEDDELH